MTPLRRVLVMPSIEILIESPITGWQVDSDAYPFAVAVTAPPVSHRSPSLWQEEFARIGGALVHLGEPRFKGDMPGWFYAYDLLEIDNNDRFRFKAQYLIGLVQLLTELTRDSICHTVHFTTDYQFGPKRPIRYPDPLRLREFVRLHGMRGLKFNSWRTILAEAEW